MARNVIDQNETYVIYQSEGSSRFNVAKKTKKGDKFQRGFRTLEEARFFADNKGRVI